MFRVRSAESPGIISKRTVCVVCGYVLILIAFKVHTEVCVVPDSRSLTLGWMGTVSPPCAFKGLLLAQAD